MPYKFDTLKIRLPEKFDRRVKIPKSEHAYIKQFYKQGMAIRAIARKYKVSSRLIQFILFPDRFKKQKLRIKQNWKKYSDRKILTEAARNLRRYKSKLFNKELIK